MHLWLKKETCKNCSNTEQKNKHVQPTAMHKYEAQLALIIYKWGHIPLKIQEIKTVCYKLYYQHNCSEHKHNTAVLASMNQLYFIPFKYFV
jgi:hypothetical protein